MQKEIALLIAGLLLVFLLALAGIFVWGATGWPALLVLAVALTLGAVVAWLWFSRRIVRPINDLTEDVGQMAGGDWQRRIEVSGNDEISVLGLAINRLVDALADANRALEQQLQAKEGEIALLDQQLAVASDHLEHMLEDKLTGISNRAGFDRALQSEWLRCQRRAEPLSLLFMDVDYFKDFNDYLGHMAGDDALHKVAQVLAGRARRTGDIAARYGGDEFVLLLPGVSQAQAEEVARTVQDDLLAMNIRHPRSRVARTLTLSLGVATLIPNTADQPSRLVEAADEALYSAKAAGRNRYCVAENELSHSVS